MADQLDEYLSSPQAVADVRALLEGAAKNPGPITLGWEQGATGPWKWLEVGAVTGFKPRVYFRPDQPILPRNDLPLDVPAGPSFTFGLSSQRYIVTDLGEAVRALRLRTGRVEWTRLTVDQAIDDDDILHSNDAMLMPNVPASDLAAAIVRVLLAAHRVATLEFHEERFVHPASRATRA